MEATPATIRRGLEGNRRIGMLPLAVPHSFRDDRTAPMTSPAPPSRTTRCGAATASFDNGPRLRVDDNPAIENADRITIEAWVNVLSWPGGAVVCRKGGQLHPL
jgi:hypothetical protein